jgi:curved DNA-binding protein
MTHYDTLGIRKDATEAEIKSAYRKLAKTNHPDSGGNIKDFQKISEAHEVLSDPQKRQIYDLSLNPSNPFGGNHQRSQSNGPNPFQGEPIFNDIFRHFFAENIHRPSPNIINQPVSITLKEAYTGGKKIINIHDKMGNVITVDIDIPRGIMQGTAIQIQQKDFMLVVSFIIEPDPVFKRHGNDLVATANIDIFDLIIGAKIPIDTISGNPIELTIPPDTPPDTIFKVQGKGMPSGFNNRHGDLLIHLKAAMPPNIPYAIKEMIKNYKGRTI